MNKKRGQITLFIIIGIVLLLGVSLVLFMQKSTIKVDKTDIPKEIAGVYQFVEGCIGEIAKKDLNLLGHNGGYIKIPKKIENDPFSHISTNPLFPNLKVPYWWYENQDRIPTESFIKEQLQDSMNEQLITCVKNFTDFKQLNISSEDLPKTIVDLGDSNVLYDIEWLLNVKQEDKLTKINRFTITRDVRLKKVLELATQIMQQENKEYWFEDLTLDLISLDPEIPTTSFDVSCSPKVWLINKVKNKLEKLLEVNVPLIKVKGTKHREENQEYVKNRFAFRASETDYPDMHVTFKYDPKWRYEFYGRPNNGLFLTSGQETGQNVDGIIDMSWLCLQTHHFTYDVKFPIMITVRDEENRKTDEYLFNFAFPVIIKNNQPDKTTEYSKRFDFETSPLSLEYCAQESKKNLTIRTVNKVTNEDIPDINISFDCFKFKCGNVGVTDYMEGNIAGYRASLPLCYNGLYKTEGKNYKTERTMIDNSQDKINTIKMTPIREIYNYTVIKHFLENLEQDSDYESELDENEQVAIFIEHKDHSSFGFYPSEEPIPLIFLADDTYEYSVKLYIMNNDEIVGGYIGKLTIDNIEDIKSIKFNAIATVEDLDEEQFIEFYTQLSANSNKVSTELIE